LLGTLINFGLHGFLCVQVCTYYMTFPNDRVVLKILVYGCFIIETLQTILLALDGFDAIVTHKGDILSLDRARLCWLSTTVLSGIVTTIGQLLYAHRLRVMYNSWPIPISIAILSMCAGVTQMTIGAQIHSSGRISSLFTDSFRSSLVFFIANMLCDIEITICIIYYLLRHRPISNSRLHYQVRHLIRLIIETGSLIATTLIVCSILFISFKNSFYFIVPYLTISKLYSNTLVLMLNNRVAIPGGRNDIKSDNTIISWWGPNSAVTSSIHAGPHGEGQRPSSTNIGEVVRGGCRAETDHREVIDITPLPACTGTSC
ncbi:hypothetical protein BDZ94DRAFT_1174575, partial [Collybia nuda]